MEADGGLEIAKRMQTGWSAQQRITGVTGLNALWESTMILSTTTQMMPPQLNLLSLTIFQVEAYNS